MIIENRTISYLAPANPLVYDPVTLNDAKNFGKQSFFPALKPSIHVDNRKGMNKYLKSAKIAQPMLQRVIDLFVKAVFEVEPEVSYKVIYDEFHNQWMEVCSRIQAMKLKNIIVDTHFFANQYFPTK